jgi:predicted NBD/HSP70 family sugar kinase
MYVGVDVGGTKTLLAVLNEHGEIRHSVKFPTSQNYDHFLLELRNAYHHLPTQEFKAGAVGIPAVLIDREHGRGKIFGNLAWKNVPIQHDLERIFHCPFVVENDAKLAGLSEAMLLRDKFEKVLYVTVSTGIGYALINSGEIDKNIGDGGGKEILLPHRGKHVPWESYASGHAIVMRYGKRAEDIHDETTWRKISRDLAQGLIELIAIAEPDTIVFGGSVGNFFDRYHHLLKDELQRYHLPLLPLPELRKAERPEEAVVYGCYDIAKQTFGHATVNQ